MIIAPRSCICHWKVSSKRSNASPCRRFCVELNDSHKTNTTPITMCRAVVKNKLVLWISQKLHHASSQN
jgi:hypothetical protein